MLTGMLRRPIDTKSWSFRRHFSQPVCRLVARKSPLMLRCQCLSVCDGSSLAHYS